MSGEFRAKLSACPSDTGVYPCFHRLPPVCTCPRDCDDDPVIKERRTKESKQSSDDNDTDDDCRVYTMEPRFSVRIETEREVIKARYVIPKTQKQIDESIERRKKVENELNFCKYTVLAMPPPPDLQQFQKIEEPGMKVKQEFPQKASDLYGKFPDPPEKEVLELKKPKSGIILNEKIKPKRRRAEPEKKESIISCYRDADYCICGGEKDDGKPPIDGEKRKRKKFIAITRATSVESMPPPDEKPSKEPCVCEPCKVVKKVKDEPVFKKKRKDPRFDFNFYYGSKLGSTFLSENLGFCTPIVAFCFSHIKHPSKWNENNIDDIITMSHNFYKDLGIQQPTPRELPPYIIICNKKVRFEVSMPEIAGTVKSTDMKVYSLNKAMRIFFKRNRSGILQTIDHNIVFWKDRYFYMFDGNARNNELFHCCQGAAALGHFYTLNEMISILLKRSDFDNSPFNIHTIIVSSVEDKDKPDPSEETYKLVCDGEYGIIRTSWDLGDRRFGFARNKQSLCIALLALLESKISPASAWTKDMVDKIMVLGNRLHVSLIKCGMHEDYYLDFEDIPGVIQVGPYWIELYIKPNCFVGAMGNDFDCCFVEKYLKCHTTMLLQIDRFHIAVWKQRGLFFMFDPYIRDCLGLKSVDGYGCVTLHHRLDSLVKMIQKNFDGKCPIFRINSIKYCHITPCPIDRCDCRKAAERIDENLVTPVCSKIIIARNVKDFDIDLNRKIEEDFVPQKADLVVDLDSASLSETQIEPVRIITPSVTSHSVSEPEPEEDWYDYCICDDSIGEQEEGEDAYYYAKSVTTQVCSRSLLSEDLEEPSPIPKELLPPTLYEIPPPFSLAMALQKDEQPSITASEEWIKESMFVELPDGTQILLGTKSLVEMEPLVEFAAPFACIMAITVAKKFAISTWTSEVVDYVLTCGSNLYRSSTARFDQVYKIEIPMITLGADSFSVEVEYCLDSTVGNKILEQTLCKVLPTPAIFVSPVYSCAIIEKHHLYYLFDCFPSNKVGFGDGIGTAYLARFKDLRSLIHRLLHNKKQREVGESFYYDRFVLSYCHVRVPDYDKVYGMEEDEGVDEIIDIPKPKIIKGYQEIDGLYKITGTRSVERNSSHPNVLGADFFICILACLKLFNHSIETWDNLMVDQVVSIGQKMVEHASGVTMGQKLTIRNVLIDGYFFDFIIRTIKQFERALRVDFLLLQNRQQFLLAHKTEKTYHFFDPCSKPAGWIRVEDYEGTCRNLKYSTWYGFQITSFKKAPKYFQESALIEEKKQPPEKYDKPFYEDPCWLDLEPIPWSPKIKAPTNRWYNWYEIYPNDLYVIWGTTHQKDYTYGDKATLANIMVAEAFVETYPLDQWSQTLVDSILDYGEIFFKEVSEAIQTANYEIDWDDFKQLGVPPYIYTFQYHPVVEGTMFLVHPKSFNLYKALRYFLKSASFRIGVLTRSYRKAGKKFLLFGKLGVGSYFMYDCQSFCLPLFRENEGVSYIIKATSLNRLLHVMVLTLKGGDFYIYEVKTRKTYIPYQ